MNNSFLSFRLRYWYGMPLQYINTEKTLLESPIIIIRRRQWHPTPVVLPGKSHGWRSLVGCSPWGCKESDTTERLHFHFSLSCTREGNGNPLQCSCLENPRDGGAWWAAIYGVAQSRTRQSDFTLAFHFHALEKETAPHSSILAWRIPGMAEPGGLPSMGSWESARTEATQQQQVRPWNDPGGFPSGS